MTTILPPELEALLDRGESLRVRCPAGEARTRNGKEGVQCKIEQQFLPMDAAALAVAHFCCTEYTECPSWQAAQRNDPAVKRQHEATERRRQERLTERMIETGVRVDDRAERDLAREVEEMERAPEGPTANDMKSRGKGQIWVPGED